MASLFPACDPPLITLKAGTGSTSVLFPARFAMCCQYVDFQNPLNCAYKII